MKEVKWHPALSLLYQYPSVDYNRAPDRVHIFISKMPIFPPNPMFDHLLESSHRDDSDKWSNIGFGEKITQVMSIEVYYMHLIWSSVIGGESCNNLTSLLRLCPEVCGIG